MPYTVADVDTHIKNLGPKAKRAWVAIANSALTKCVSAGGKEAACAGKAIIQANGVAGKMKESATLEEAATLKSQAQSLLRQLKAILGRKDLAAGVHERVQATYDDLSKRWADLAPVDSATTTAAESASMLDPEALLEAAGNVLGMADSFDGIRQLVQQALRVRAMQGSMDAGGYGYDGPSCWIRDLYADTVVYSEDDRLYRCDYSIAADDTVTLGTPTEVEVAYVTVVGTTNESEHIELTGDLIPLVEKSVRRDGTVPIVIATEGWGSSGYYSADVLKRDGPKVFTRGLQSYFDHPSLEEEAQRPERSVRDLLGVLESDARWQDEGQAGPGLYADLKVFPQHTESLEAMAPHVGMSLRADGIAPYGEAEGKKGRIVESLVSARSVDCVTAAGRGGAILQLFEAARNGRVSGGNQVDENEARALREAASTAQIKLTEAEAKLVRLGEVETQLARMTEGLLLRDARSFVATELAGIQLPDMTRARLSESLSANPPVKDGALDLDAYRVRIKENAAAELEYLAKVTGAGSGRITGLGGNTSSVEITAEEADKRLDEEFKSLLGESAGAHAASGRVN